MQIYESDDLYIVLTPQSSNATIDDILVHIKAPRDLYRLIKGMQTNEISLISIIHAKAVDSAKMLLEAMKTDGNVK